VRVTRTNERLMGTARLELAGRQQTEANATMEMNAVKKIVRENWESKVKEKGTNVDILSKHADFMNRQFGSMGYETMCMPHVVLNTKKMSRSEIIAYTRMLEALAIGYRDRFGSEFGGQMVAGATIVSKDVRGMRKLFDYFMLHISKNAFTFERAVDKEVRIIERLNYELGRKDSGLFKFFRKKDIAELKKRINIKRAKIGKFESKRMKYSVLSDALNAKIQGPRLSKQQRIGL
jgi:hypothetical protein